MREEMGTSHHCGPGGRVRGSQDKLASNFPFHGLFNVTRYLQSSGRTDGDLDTPCMGMGAIREIRSPDQEGVKQVTERSKENIPGVMQ